MRQSTVAFDVNGLSMEGVVAEPDGGGEDRPGVVVCHPHPLYGGNMDNNVVLALSFSLTEQGFATLRFNFRGVGGSQGEHAKGELEHEEVSAALQFLAAWPGVGSGRMGLAGYSFGASVILRRSELHDKAQAFALVSPPAGALEGTGLAATQHPVFLIVGDRDRVLPSDKVGPLLEPFASPPAAYVAPGIDHYWAGSEQEMAPRVAQFFTEALQ